MWSIAQHVIVAVVVTIAVGYVLLRSWRLLRGTSRRGCERCSACLRRPSFDFLDRCESERR